MPLAAGVAVKERVVFRLHAVCGEGRTAKERKAEAYSLAAVKFAAANLVKSLTQSKDLHPEWSAKLTNLDTHFTTECSGFDVQVGDVVLKIRRAT